MSSARTADPYSWGTGRAARAGAKQGAEKCSGGFIPPFPEPGYLTSFFEAQRDNPITFRPSGGRRV